MGYLLDDEEKKFPEIDPRVKEFLLTKHQAQAPQPSESEKYQKQYGDEAYKKVQADADEQKSGLGWAQFAAGIGDAMAGRSPANSAQAFQDIRQGIDANTTGAFEKRKAGAMNDIKTKKSFEGSDPNSKSSISFRKSIEANFPATAKQYGENWASVTADDQEIIFKPLQLRENIESRKETAKILAHDRAEARSDKRDERSKKTADLSAVQAKQMGLYNSGKKAEEQYNKAIGDSSDFDPTSSGQWIDTSGWAPNWMKNDKAIESQAAQSSWIESFLRDASGAAIPHNERAAYAQDFFPQPGDTTEVVANKAELRKQKMDNALIGSGHEGRIQATTKKPERKIVDRQVNKKTGQTRVVYSDGTTEIISQEIAGGR